MENSRKGETKITEENKEVGRAAGNRNPGERGWGGQQFKPKKDTFNNCQKSNELVVQKDSHVEDPTSKGNEKKKYRKGKLKNTGKKEK